MLVTNPQYRLLAFTCICSGIIGRSGGGKSVLLKDLIGLLRPDEGAIVIGGTDITSAPKRRK